MNENNFIHVNNVRHELTVTVSLDEYRDLIRQQCWLEEIREKLEKSEKERTALAQMIYTHAPNVVVELLNDLSEVVTQSAIERFRDELVTEDEKTQKKKKKSKGIEED